MNNLKTLGAWLEQFGINTPPPQTLSLEQVRPELEAAGYVISPSQRTHNGKTMTQLTKFAWKWLRRRATEVIVTEFPLQLKWIEEFDPQTSEVVFSASQTQWGNTVRGLTYAKYGVADIRVKLPIKLVREDHGYEDEYTSDWVPYFLYREA